MTSITIDDMIAEGAKNVYNRLSSDRTPYTDRAKNCAKYTIPNLFPDSSDDKSTSWSTPYSSIGARGVNNLSSKITLALMPPNINFFRLSIDAKIQTQYSQQPSASGQGTVLNEVEQALADLESRVLKYAEGIQTRPTLFACVQQLIVSGNGLLFLPPKEDGIRLYTLWDYVLLRDSMGTIIKIVTVDKVAFAALPPEAQNLLTTEHKPEDVLEVYTYVCLADQNYISFQEIEGQAIPGHNQSYPVDKTPYIAPRLYKQDGESYGRSFCETYYGDLVALDKLSYAILKYSALAAQCYFLVNPASNTSVKKLNAARSGDFIPGKVEDIGVLQLNKQLDLQVAVSEIDKIESRLSFAFLLSSVVQRNAERVNNIALYKLL